MLEKTPTRSILTLKKSFDWMLFLGFIFSVIILVSTQSTDKAAIAFMSQVTMLYLWLRADSMMVAELARREQGDELQ